MAILSITTIAVSTLFMLVLYKVIIYPLFVSPLSKIPAAHPTATVSPLWILYIRRTGWENRKVYAAHQRLGPIIRVGPNEVSINCVDGGIRTIYSGGWEKGDWYRVFENYDTPNAFSSLEHHPHSLRKRIISNVYAKSTLHASPALGAMCEVLLCQRLLPKLAAKGDKPVEAYELFSACAMDFVTAYIFGMGQSTTFLLDEQHCREKLQLFKSRQEFSFWSQETPGLLWALESLGLEWLVYPNWVKRADQEVADWLFGRCEATEAAILSGKISRPEDEPVVYSQLRKSLTKQSEGTDAEKGAADSTITKQQLLELASEVNDQTFAGFDTTGIALTYLAWEISKPENASVQAALRKELREGLSPGFRAAEGDEKQPIPDHKTMEALPILQSVLMETLRLHASIPGQQPRMSPRNASLGPTETAIHGVPANVRVSSRAYTLHRNSDVFPEPEAWLPSRWLDADGKMDNGGEKARWFWAFGSGGRMCLGKNLAMMEMSSIVAAMWSNFATSIIDDSGMEHRDGYISEPLGTSEGTYLLLRFTRLE